MNTTMTNQPQAEEWKISKRGRSCSVCQREFRSEEVLYSGIAEIEGRFERRDVCVPCWDKKPELFSFTWHPYAIDPNVDYSQETPTLVEFRLEKSATGTLLVVTESGFDKIPPHRQIEALRMNDNGWAIQTQNIEKYVAQHP